MCKSYQFWLYKICFSNNFIGNDAIKEYRNGIC